MNLIQYVQEEIYEKQEFQEWWYNENIDAWEIIGLDEYLEILKEEEQNTYPIRY